MRSPAFPVDDYGSRSLQDLLNVSVFRSAIATASPSLFNELLQSNFELQLLSPKAKLSVEKYANRMHYRATPFGLFAHVSSVKWGQDALSIPQSFQATIEWSQPRINHYFKNFIQNDPAMKLYPNPSIYYFSGSIRFIKTYWNDQRSVKYSVEEIQGNEVLSAMLNDWDEIRTLGEIVKWLTEAYKLSKRKAQQYIASLAESQLLLTEIHRPVISKASVDVEAINALIPGCRYKCIMNNINPSTLNRDIDRELLNSSFYIYSSVHVKGEVSATLQAPLTNAIALLNNILPFSPNPELELFKKAFIKRFDQQQVALTALFDPDAGIGYDHLNSIENGNIAAATLPFDRIEEAPAVINWTDLHRFLIENWPGQTSFESFIDLQKMQPSPGVFAGSVPVLPATLSVLFRPLEKGVLMEAAGGSSAVNLISRFAHFDNEILQCVKAINEYEQQESPDMIFAELSILSSQHTDNINRRPAVFHHEICINTLPSGGKNVLPLKDLYVAVRNNKVQLFSRSLGKEVHPRHTSAFNTGMHDLPLFRFLCDLQFQDIRGNLSFDPEWYLPRLKWYPRIVIGEVIVSPAKWYLNKKDLAMVITFASHYKGSYLPSVRQHFGLPEIIVLKEADQHLVINLQDNKDAGLFKSFILNKESICITEYLPTRTGLFKDPKQVRDSQFVGFLKTSRSIIEQNTMQTSLQATQRMFPPGSQWLYVKIYCNEGAADGLISLLKEIIDNKKCREIKKWFFVRYYDPDHHIRLRINYLTGDVGRLMTTLNSMLAMPLADGVVSVWPIDTYQRELERYALVDINLIESQFWKSSDLIYHLIRNGHSSDEFWQLRYVSRMFFDLAKCFLPNTEDQFQFFKERSEKLLEETGNLKQYFLQFNSEFRLYQKQIKSFLSTNDQQGKWVAQRYYKSFLQSTLNVAHFSRFAKKDDNLVLLSDLIHMHGNRCFKSQQRLQEGRVCYLLSRFLKSELYNKN